MNKNIDLTKILKDCPKGTKFYSSAHGNIEFITLLDLNKILFAYKDCNYDYDLIIQSNGKLYNNGECIIFPSKEQRDWSKFTAPWYKKDRFDPETLKPYDKVLVRDDDPRDCWRCAFYSHTRGEEQSTSYRYATSDNSYTFCIPYNDDTKHLVGKTDEAPEYYRYWED